MMLVLTAVGWDVDYVYTNEPWNFMKVSLGGGMLSGWAVKNESFPQHESVLQTEVIRTRKVDSKKCQ
jgi:hypothetical protein